MNESCLSSPEAALHCGAAWLLKTKMSFYGQELHLPWWFGVGCITYSFSGVVMLLYVPSWLSKSRFPYFSFAYFLIFLQGPLSFLADFCNMSNDSIFHVLDRATAAPAMLLEIGKLATMVYYGERRITLVLYFLATSFALFSYAQSQLAQSMVDREAFVLWHTMWHMYPILASVIIAVDRHVLSSFVIHYETRSKKVL